MSSARAGRVELLAASVLTGVFGAITIYASELKIGLEGFAPLAQLWTFWALCAASVTFATQQWAIRAVVVGLDDLLVFRMLAKLLVPIAIAVGALCWVLAGPWFDGHQGFAILSGLLVLGTGLNGFGRGRAAARDSVRVLAVVIVGENLIRLVLLVPLVLLDAAPIWYGVALVAGFAVNVLVIAGHGSGPAALPSASTGSAELVTAGLVGLVSYATMFGGPLLLAPAGVAAATVSALFLVVTLARIPFVVVVGVLPRVAVHLERLTSERRYAELRRFTERIVLLAIAGAAGVAGLAIVGADATVGRVLGTTGEFGSDVYALIGSASVLALASLVLSMALLSTGRHVELAVVWAIPVVTAGLGLATGWLGSVERLSVLLVVVEIALLAALAALHLRQAQAR